MTIQTTFRFEPGAWWRLPLTLRQRYWRETDYGRKEPSDELRREIADALWDYLYK